MVNETINCNIHSLSQKQFKKLQEIFPKCEVKSNDETKWLELTNHIGLFLEKKE